MSISHVNSYARLHAMSLTTKTSPAADAANANSAQVNHTAPSNFAAYLEQAQAIKPVNAVNNPNSGVNSTTSNHLTAPQPNVGAATFLGQDDDFSSFALSGQQFAQLLEQAQQQLSITAPLHGHHPSMVGQLQELNTSKAPLSAREQLAAQVRALSATPMPAPAPEVAPAAPTAPATSASASLSASAVTAKASTAASAHATHTTSPVDALNGTQAVGGIIAPSVARTHAPSANAAKVIDNIAAVDQAYGDESVQAMQGFADVVARMVDEHSSLNLQDKIFDFSALLPAGTRELIGQLNCSEGELNDFVNVMVFGTEQGPHGRNIAEFMGQDSMTLADFKSKLEGLLGHTHINSPALSSNDFDYVLRPQDSQLGQTIAINNGADLEGRILERELDSTFKRDMALMQILARSNDQSANLF